MVAKRLTSPYQPGQRSRAWIKTPIRHTAEVIVAGWSPSTGNANVLGALLLAAYRPDGELVYVGDVGTGFTDAAWRRPLELLRPLGREDSPFPGAVVRARGWPGRPPGRGLCIGWRRGWWGRLSIGRLRLRAASGIRRGGGYGRTAIRRRSTPAER